jgi:hypothetical protein
VAVPEIMRRVVVEGGFPAASAGIIIYSAAQYMCPDTLAYLEDQANRAQEKERTTNDDNRDTWTCEQCGAEVTRWRGQYDTECDRCHAQYNASAQRLRDDWRTNPSNYDDEIGDMEGYEIACLRREIKSGEF